MQDTFGVILLALVDKEPKILNLREMINYYIAHQEDVITRRTTFDLNKALDRAHILEGYKIVIDNVEEVIKIIRASKSIPDAKEALCSHFGLTDPQADAIVKMQLGRLSGMERDKIEEEYAELTEKIADYRDILANENRILEIVKEDLIDIKNKYGDERRTEISMITTEIDIDDLIDEEDIVVTLTHSGYTKRLPVDTYKSQRRGGRGISGMTTRDEDFVEHLFATTTHHTLLFFTNRGYVYKLKGYQIPEASRQAKGMAIVNLLPIESDEKITAMIAIKDFEEGKYLTFITRNGIVKKTGFMDYSRIRNGGLRAIDLDEGDKLIRVELTDGDNDIILATHDGYAIRFNEQNVRSTGRTTRGVMGIRLHEGDYVIGASLATPNTQLLTITENGYGKKTPLDEYRIQTRGGLGIFTYRITEKTGKLAGMDTVTDDDDIILITSDGVIIRMHADEISSYSRQTQGVRVMRLDEGVKVVSSARTDRMDEDADDDNSDDENTDQLETEGDNE
jgi:DNA gyrase subunit A